MVAEVVDPPNFCRMLSNDGGVNSKAIDSLENLANERLCKGLKPVTMLTATIATISLIIANAILERYDPVKWFDPQQGRSELGR